VAVDHLSREWIDRESIDRVVPSLCIILEYLSGRWRCARDEGDVDRDISLEMEFPHWEGLTNEMYMPELMSKSSEHLGCDTDDEEVKISRLDTTDDVSRRSSDDIERSV
jgi:hypothetical protein